MPFSDRLYTLISEPLLRSLPKGGQLIAIEVTSTFFVPVKLAFFAALMVAMPVVLYQLWSFVAPGLYDKEKRLARPILVAATVLFYAGCAFTYFLLLPVMFAYLSGTAPVGVAMMTDISHYLDFVLVMFLAGGISFEVPVAVIIAVILGWVTPKQLSEWRGYVIVGSPDDVVEQLREVATNMNVGHLMLLLQYGNMSKDLAKYNTKLFAEAVMPKLKPMFAEWEDKWWPKPMEKSGRATVPAFTPAVRAAE